MTGTAPKTEREIREDYEASKARWQFRMVKLAIVAALAAGAVQLLCEYAVGDLLQHNAFARAVLDYALYPLIFMALMFAGRVPKQPEPPAAVVRRDLDAYQAEGRTKLAMTLAILFGFTLFVSASVTMALAENPIKAGAIGCLFLYIVVHTAWRIANPGKTGTDDEYTRALKSRATTAGFFALLLAVSIGGPVALYRPSWTAQIFIWALFTGGAGPALYYVIADWQASRDG